MQITEQCKCLNRLYFTQGATEISNKCERFSKPILGENDHRNGWKIPLLNVTSLIFVNKISSARIAGWLNIIVSQATDKCYI